MKRRSTMLKAASVMLAAIMMGTSCQKQVEAPETLTNEVSVSASSGEAFSFPMNNMNGKRIGELRISEEGGFARMDVLLPSTLARNASAIMAVMHNQSGEKYVINEAFSFQSTGMVIGEGHYVSVTSPVADVFGKRPTFKEFWNAVQGFSVITYDDGGERLAIGTVR